MGGYSNSNGRFGSRDARRGGVSMGRRGVSLGSEGVRGVKHVSMGCGGVSMKFLGVSKVIALSFVDLRLVIELSSDVRFVYCSKSVLFYRNFARSLGYKY